MSGSLRANSRPRPRPPLRASVGKPLFGEPTGRSHCLRGVIPVGALVSETLGHPRSSSAATTTVTDSATVTGTSKHHEFPDRCANDRRVCGRRARRPHPSKYPRGLARHRERPYQGEPDCRGAERWWDQLLRWSIRRTRLRGSRLPLGTVRLRHGEPCTDPSGHAGDSSGRGRVIARELDAWRLRFRLRS